VTSLAVVLYEDQRGPMKEFGLHHLILACVRDDSGADAFALRGMLDGRPMKGVQNLLRSCRRDVRRLSSKGQLVFALIDNDEIRQQLRHEGVESSAEDDAVVRAIKAKCDAPERLRIFLLKNNTETVIEAAAFCDEDLPKPLLAQALKKDPNARDAILNKIAWRPDRSVRDCIREQVQAVAEISRALANIVCDSDDANIACGGSSGS
jgi:hypothetical protein